MNKRTVARIFREVNGLYYVCDDSIPALDARGQGYRTKAEAMRAAARDYTHAVGSGTYWAGVRSLKPYL
jgi:hypothetical protein